MAIVKMYFDPKSPEDQAPFTLDFSLWLKSGDLVTSASATTSNPSVPSDTTLIATGADISADGKSVTTTLSGGTAGNVYLVHYLIGTSAGIVIQRSASLQVFER